MAVFKVGNRRQLSHVAEFEGRTSFCKLATAWPKKDDIFFINGFTQNLEKFNFSKLKKHYRNIVRAVLIEYFRYCTSDLFCIIGTLFL